MDNTMHFLSEDGYEALKASGTGLWRLESEVGKHNRFYGDETMGYLIGISEDTTPEDRFDIFMSRIHKDDLKLFMEYYNKLKESARAEVVYRYVHPELGIIYVRCMGNYTDRCDGIIRYRGIHQNVTDTIRVEQENRVALTKQAEMFKTLAFKMMQHSADSIASINVDTSEIDWVNLKGVEIDKKADYDSIFLDVSVNVPEEYRDKFIEESKLATVLSILSTQGFYYFSAFIHRPEDGELRRLTYWYYTIDNDPTHILSIFRDTTEEYEKEQQLEKALLESKKANAAKTVFLNNMSHDIRTPMNAIVGFTDLAQKHIDDRDKCLDYLSKIKTSSKHLLDLVNDVLDMSRIESGRMTLHYEPCSMTELVEGVKTIIRNDAEDKGLDLTVSISDITNDSVLCDKLRLRQVLLNCASNSVKFTPPGGKVSISLKELDCDIQDNTAKYQFDVTDTGIGMSKDYISKIFDPFSREENKVHTIQGTGLGMTICKRIVDNMGGTIDVSSELGKGTTISIIVSFALTDSVEIDKPLQEEVDISVLKGKRILLAEDNDLNTEIATLILSESGLIVEHAEDGARCVEMVKEAKVGYYDIILMDIQMPNLNGYQATEAIRALDDLNKSSIPIIAMTANAFEEDKKKAINSGMNGHLSKPINVHKLFEQLASLY